MPIIGTPGLAPSQPCCPPEVAGSVTPAPVACDAIPDVSATVSQLNRAPLLGRMRSVVLTQGQVGRITWQLHDPSGAPIDLTGCGFDSDVSETSESLWGTEGDLSVEFRMRDGIDGSCNPILVKDAFIEAAGTGQVYVELDPGDTARAGIYRGEMALVKTVDGTQHVLVSNQFYVIINRSNFGPGSLGPPTLAEIRLALRDSSPGENLLLDTLKFDNAELAMAISRPIEYWNEVPPTLNHIFTTRDFPYRFHWLEAICGLLFQITAEHMRANQLDYSAGGVTVNDKNKELNYEQVGARRWQAWKDFVRLKKGEINLADGYGGIGSQYANIW